jgi:hypothetical protein
MRPFVAAAMIRVAGVRLVITTTVLRVASMPLVASILVVGYVADSAVISSAAVTHKSMAAPAMVISIARPWAHTHEDPVIEIA